MHSLTRCPVERQKRYLIGNDSQSINVSGTTQGVYVVGAIFVAHPFSTLIDTQNLGSFSTELFGSFPNTFPTSVTTKRAICRFSTKVV